MISLTLAQRHGKKNPKKEDCYEALVDIWNTNADTKDESLVCKFAVLFNYFEPKVTKKSGTDKFAWLFQAVTTDPTREVLMYAYCDGDFVVATDGRRLHLMPNEEGLAKGYYNQRKELIPEQDHPYTYPNYKQVIPNYSGSEVKIEMRHSELVADSSERVRRKIIHYKHIVDEFKINLQYLKEATTMDEKFTVLYDAMPAPFLLKLSGGRLAVIMPVRKDK